jgi:hypothetical protein
MCTQVCSGLDADPGVLVSDILAFRIGTAQVDDLADYIVARGGTVLSPPDAPVLRFQCGAKSDLSTLLRTLGYKVVEVRTVEARAVFDIKLLLEPRRHREHGPDAVRGTIRLRALVRPTNRSRDGRKRLLASPRYS